MRSVRHKIPSECWSVDDDTAAQSFNSWEYLIKAIKTASSCQINCDNPFANAFPGDHYRILAGLISNLDRSSGSLTLVDIGTHFGTSARTMLDFSHPEDTVVTFDVTPWTEYNTTYLTETDFSSRLVQYIEDLQDSTVWARRKELFVEADFIMCDGPKDGKFERTFFELLSTLSFYKKPRWLFLDDIRFTGEMVSWRSINSPKIDLTSFGHFSGTGLVDISEGFKFS